MSLFVSCKELVGIFNKVGGKMMFNYDTKKCTFLPQNIVSEIKPENNVDIDSLLMDFAYQHDKYVTHLPIVDNTKCIEKLHNYQEKDDVGFTIEFAKNEDGYIIPTKKSM
jgi:hypothetical protein